jgi:hypothetical protein
MKRIIAYIISLVAPFAGFSAEIKKETPIAYYSMTNLAQKDEIGVCAKNIFMEFLEEIEATAKTRPYLFSFQPVTYLIEVLPSGFIRTLERKGGDSSYVLTDSLNDAMSLRHWCFSSCVEREDQDIVEMERVQLTIYPKCFKETPIAYYLISGLVHGDELTIYTVALFREFSEVIEKTLSTRPQLLANQPVTYLIEVLPSGFVRTLYREDGDPTYGLTDMLNEAMSVRHWSFHPFWEKLDHENMSMERVRLTIYPKCLIFDAERTVHKDNKIILEGDAKLTYGKYRIAANEIEYNPLRRNGSADGSVHFNISKGEYVPAKGLVFSFREDGALANYFWEGLE